MLEVCRVSEHGHHKMHKNSMEAWRRMQAAGLDDTRELEVYEYVRDHPGVTDHEVQEGLGKKERNDVSPAITRLVQAGRLEEGDKVMGELGFPRRTLYVKGAAPPRRQGDLF